MAENTDFGSIPDIKYEYLDHTADVQNNNVGPLQYFEVPVMILCWFIKATYVNIRLHAWGDDLTEAFEQVVMSMFGYMTEIDTVEMKEAQEIEAEGDDMMSLLFHVLDEFLFLFCAEPFFIVRKVKITEFDKENFRVKAVGYGEEFDLAKHPQGTEVKAITYSNMQIYDEEKHEVFVIIDI